MTFNFTVAGVMEILADLDPKMLAPEITFPDKSEIEFEWYVNLDNVVVVNFGGDYGDGFIFERCQGLSVKHEYSPKQLLTSTNKLMAIAYNLSPQSAEMN